MASIIKSNTYADFNGREILTANNNGALTTMKALFPAFSARLNSNQTLTTATYTKGEFDTEIFDSDNKYDSSTNYRFTPGVAGYYHVSVTGYVQSTNGTFGRAAIFKNGSQYLVTANLYGAGNYQTQQVSATMYLSDTDYIEAYFRQQSGSNQTLLGENGDESNFCAFRIGS